MSIYGSLETDYTRRKPFLDGDIGLVRYDKLALPYLYELTKKQRGFFWQPEEVTDIIRDKNDFATLSEHEKHIFVSNLKRQMLLDSVQGRAPVEAFSPVASIPELEIWLQTWTFSETIHSDSYTYILRNVFPDPSVVFDEINDIQEILDCAADISKYYDELIHYNHLRYMREQDIDSDDIYSSYNHKKAIWLALNAVNVLEGIRFYVSFASSWSFAERNKMEGNAKIIKFICRDENLHLASTQYLIRMLPQVDSDFQKIAENFLVQEQTVRMFEEAVEQEKAWARYLFKDGSMLGLTERILCEYVEYIARQRMKAIDLPTNYDVKTNPLPWTLKWISGRDIQDASQEVTKSQYIVGGVKPDVSKDFLKGLKL